MKVIIIGGVAGGASAAARLRRLDETAEIILLERSGYISYANCGLPYYIGGVIREKGALSVQTPESFGGRFRIDVRVKNEAVSIDPKEKTVRIRKLETGEEYVESYDRLLLSPGAKAIRPALPGIGDPRIMTLRTVEDTFAIRDYLEKKKPKRAVVVGGGFIGLETAENLMKEGIAVTLLQRGNQVLPPLDYDMACQVHAYLRGKGLDLRTVYYTGNRALLAAFKSMLADGYFQDNVAASLLSGKQRPDFVGMLHLPERYTAISRKLEAVEPSMPMRGKDFVFTDEEIGVVALKNGSDVFFGELYWRANRGINNLAKIHYLTPEAEQIATIHQEQEFIPSGKYSTEPDWVVYGFRGNRFRYPGGYYRQLKAGMKIPMAEHAEDQTFIGKAEFYRCSYGRYEIAMNSTRKNKTYRFTVPDGTYRILPDGPRVKGRSVMEVKPASTIVLCKQNVMN